MSAAIGAQTVLQHKGVGNFVFGLIFAVGVWAVGRAVRARTKENRVLQVRAVDLVKERDASDREAAAEERGRIARELHDVISHSVNVMVVQAGAAEQMVDLDPPRAADAVRVVQAAGREAIGQLAHLLGILRDGGEEVGLAPEPAIRDVRTLIASAAEAGQPVQLRVEGKAHRPAPGAELSRFRIVQEALTNVTA